MNASAFQFPNPFGSFSQYMVRNTLPKIPLVTPGQGFLQAPFSHGIPLPSDAKASNPLEPQSKLDSTVDQSTASFTKIEEAEKKKEGEGASGAQNQINQGFPGGQSSNGPFQVLPWAPVAPFNQPGRPVSFQFFQGNQGIPARIQGQNFGLKLPMQLVPSNSVPLQLGQPAFFARAPQEAVRPVAPVMVPVQNFQFQGGFPGQINFTPNNFQAINPLLINMRLNQNPIPNQPQMQLLQNQALLHPLAVKPPPLAGQNVLNSFK